jgi:hypothetical protein
MKKTLGKSKGKASTPAKKKSSRKSKKPVDLAEVRKEITNIVGSEATELAKAVVEEGRKGQLAPVKYLFEVAGLYPAMEGSQAKPEEASLAKTLLHRLGILDQPVIIQDDEPPLKLGLPARKSANEAEEGSDNPASQPRSQNDKGADEGDDVPVLAESIP